MGLSNISFLPLKDAAAATAEGRCDHLMAITREISVMTARMESDWENINSSRFRRAGDGKPFLVPGDALSLLLARVLNTTEVLLRDRIGVPCNFFESPSRPDYLDAWESRSTRDAFKSTIHGVRQAVAGGDTGMTRLVATWDGLYEKKDPDLAREIEKQLDRIEDALSDFDGKDLDFHARVHDSPAFLKKLYKKVNRLQELIVNAALVLELDVRSGLEVQLTE